MKAYIRSPASFGSPMIRMAPINAIAMPNPCFNEIRSPNTSQARIRPKGTSSCTSSAAVEASIPRTPLKVRLYCNAALINDIQKSCLKIPGGGRKNQTMQNAVRVKRKAISRMGEKCDIPALATINPIPQITATEIAISTSTGFIAGGGE